MKRSFEGALGAICCSAIVVAFLCASAAAQPPFLKKRNETDNLPRRPNDQVEGTIWEYKGKIKKSDKTGDKPEPIKGKFRIEGTAVFDVSSRISIPSRDDARGVLDKIKNGTGIELKKPAGSQQKRIGEYRKLSNGRIRIDFDDPDTLNGMMILRKKQNTRDVWFGTYDKKEDGKVVKEYEVELRPIED